MALTLAFFFPYRSHLTNILFGAKKRLVPSSFHLGGLGILGSQNTDPLVHATEQLVVWSPNLWYLRLILQANGDQRLQTLHQVSPNAKKNIVRPIRSRPSKYPLVI